MASHSGHDHPNTTAGRRACRLGRTARMPQLVADVSERARRENVPDRPAGSCTCIRVTGWTLDPKRDLWVCAECRNPSALFGEEKQHPKKESRWDRLARDLEEVGLPIRRGKDSITVWARYDEITISDSWDRKNPDVWLGWQVAVTPRRAQDAYVRAYLRATRKRGRVVRYVLEQS